MVSKTRTVIDNEYVKLEVHVVFKDAFTHEAAAKPALTVNNVFRRLTELADHFGTEFWMHLIGVMGIGKRDA